MCCLSGSFFISSGIKTACRAPKGVNGKMKIKYEFANETVEIEVDEEWGNILVDLNRQEYNNDQKETRRHYSLDALTFEGEEYGEVDRAMHDLIEYQDLREAVSKLTDQQQYIITNHYFLGRSYTEIAKELGISIPCVTKCAERARKQIKKYFSDPR